MRSQLGYAIPYYNAQPCKKLQTNVPSCWVQIIPYLQTIAMPSSRGGRSEAQHNLMFFGEVPVFTFAPKWYNFRNVSPFLLETFSVPFSSRYPNRPKYPQNTLKSNKNASWQARNDPYRLKASAGNMPTFCFDFPLWYGSLRAPPAQETPSNIILYLEWLLMSPYVARA